MFNKKLDAENLTNLAIRVFHFVTRATRLAAYFRLTIK